MAIRKTARNPSKVNEDYPLPELVEISHDEAWQRFDARARELLGISGEEFTERWERGDYDIYPENRAATEVYMVMVPKPLKPASG